MAAASTVAAAVAPAASSGGSSRSASRSSGTNGGNGGSSNGSGSTSSAPASANLTDFGGEFSEDTGAAVVTSGSMAAGQTGSVQQELLLVWIRFGGDGCRWIGRLQQGLLLRSYLVEGVSS